MDSPINASQAQESWASHVNRRDHEVLQPLSGSSLNSLPNPSKLERSGLKRKRVDDSLGGPFAISQYYSHDQQRHQSTLDKGQDASHSKPLNLNPRLVISRSELPLAFIDADDPENQARIFFGRLSSLWALDIQSEGGQLLVHGDSKVMIVEDVDGSGLYTVSMATKNLYALVKLGSWVTLEDLRGLLETSQRPVTKYRRNEHVEENLWWRAAAIDLGTRGQSCYNRVPGAKRIQLSMKPPFPGAAMVYGEEESAPPLNLPESYDLTLERASKLAGDPSLRNIDQGSQATEINTTQALGDCNQDYTSSIESIQHLIRAQYKESLYISKTSLAYFAKGPLSRARAATSRIDSPSINTAVLIEALRSDILSKKMTETKYSKTLPALLKDFPVAISSDDEQEHIKGVLGPKLPRSKKRKELTKGGLLPGEEEYVARWCIHLNNDSARGRPDATREERMKLSIVEQRARETQLQVILILETLALEKLAKESPTLQETQVPNVNISGGKARLKEELPKLLDLLLERLCIWQSTSEEINVRRRKGTQTSSQEVTEKVSCVSNNDQLKDLCTEVIIPFYATRLPDITSSICHKLGAPSGPSPNRPKLTKVPAADQLQPPPTTAARRQSQQKPRRTLERVLTDDKLSSRRPPATLVRSATDSVLPRIKREMSSVLLSAIPLEKSNKVIPKRYSQREVDLVAVSQATEAKLQKKAVMEQEVMGELRGAIATLRKPNSRMAVKELVESAELRIVGVGLKSRKSKNPIRNPFAHGVQVMATPKGNRHKDVFGGVARLPTTYPHELQEPQLLPPSSELRIPSSSLRPRDVKGRGGLATPISKSTATRFNKPVATIEQTPSRKISQLGAKSICTEVNVDQEEDELSQESPKLPVLPSELPTFGRPSAPHRTPSYDLPPLPATLPIDTSFATFGKPRQSIKSTPVKSKLMRIEESSPAATRRQVTTPSKVDTQQSIYESLGWDDDHEIDELM